MPTVGIINNIEIVIFFRGKEHNPPHVHAILGEFDAPFLISTGEQMAGDFPKKASASVRKFVKKYRKELEEMWETETYQKLGPHK